jgi:hypothetical protein
LVTVTVRMERADWESLTNKAKARGGWYSRQWGSTPGGWAFWDAADAAAFLSDNFAP